MSQGVLLVPPVAFLQQCWDSFAATAPMNSRGSGSHWWSFSISSSPVNAQVFQVTSGVADSSPHPIILLVSLASAARAPEPCEDWTSITNIIFTGAEQYLAGQKSNTHNAHQMWASSTSHFPHESQEKLHTLCLAGLSDWATPPQLTTLGKEILIPGSAPGSTLCYSLAQEEFLESPIPDTVISLFRKYIVQESISKTNGNRRWRQPNAVSPKESC